MTDAFDRLSTTLADRYRLVRELGAGGMATVYLADELKHDRMVAVAGEPLRPFTSANTRSLVVAPNGLFVVG